MTAPERLLLETSRFRVVEVDEPHRDGSLGARQVIRHPGAVTIIPCVDAQHVCLIENRRVSVGETLLELPAGTIETQQDPLANAQRELLEETGYTGQRWTRLCSFYLSPGILDERMHLFLAEDLQPGDAQREAGEWIENRILPIDEAVRMARQGIIQDAKSLVGLLLLDGLHRR